MERFYFGWPAAVAKVTGGSETPQIKGTVSFFSTGTNVMVVADIHGLPHNEDPCRSGIFAFHIHEGGSCTGPGLSDTLSHYNPKDCLHPHHAGDLPPLFECGGHAFLAVMTDRFRIPDIIGRTVVIHSGPDDFTTQPAGNAGSKMACGVIRPI